MAELRVATEPAALQVGAGKVCAVSGRPWSERLSRDPQNYVALPRQPWLDGINSGSGTVRQFVAVPLGLGATVEGQVTGEEVWGGVQLQSFPLEEASADRVAGGRARPPHPAEQDDRRGYGAAGPWPRWRRGPRRAGRRGPGRPPAMGLGVGGRCARRSTGTSGRSRTGRKPAGRVFVHLVTPPEWRRITGEAPPPSPVDRAAYTRAGLPWFDYYDQDAEDLAPTDTLGAVKPVGDWLGDDHEPWQPPRRTR